MVEGLSPPFVDAIEKEEIGKKSSVVLGFIRSCHYVASGHFCDIATVVTVLIKSLHITLIDATLDVCFYCFE